MKKSVTKNMTQGNIFMKILTFAIPIFIGNVFQQFYNVMDTVIVGKYIGSDALAAVGVTGNIMSLMLSLIMGLTGGIAIIISQYFGAKDMKAVKRAFATSIYAIVGAMFLITIFGLIIAKPLLNILDTPANIIEDAYAFIRIIMLGLFATVLYNWMASVLRALGDSVTPLIFLVFSSVINIVLDLLFIIKFNMGVEGAAWATVIAQVVSAVLCFVYGLWKMPILRITKEDLKVSSSLLWKMIQVGLPAAIQLSFISVSIMLMQKSINAYGSVVVAGFIGATKIEQIIMQFGFSVAMAAGTFTGQNMGAGKYERVQKGVKVSAVIITCGCAIISPFVFFGSEFLMKLFVDLKQPDAMGVVNYGVEYLKTMAFFLIVVGILQIFQQMLRSAGDVLVTMIIGVSEVITRVTVAFLFSWLFGRVGIWWATPITWIVSIILGFIRYRSGKWKQKRLINEREEDYGINS